MVHFLGPETVQKRQFLGPEIVKMCQQNFWSQKLTKWFSFLGQKPDIMGKWKFMPRVLGRLPQYVRCQYELMFTYKKNTQ